MTHRTQVEIGSKRYIVVHDDQGVIRIAYDNAVTGQRSLNMDGRTAKTVLAKFEADHEAGAIKTVPR